MSENSSSSEGNGAVGRGTERPAHKGLFASVEDAQAVRPEGEKQRVYEVVKDGQCRFTWGTSTADALLQAAKADGYTARVADPKGGGPLTKERVAAKLAEFSDEELAAMGLKRSRGKK